jgi:hypothetical protein
VRSPGTGKLIDFPLDKRGSLLDRPERQPRRPNLYLEALGTSILSSGSRVAKFSCLPSDPAPAVPSNATLPPADTADASRTVTVTPVIGDSDILQSEDVLANQGDFIDWTF